ncbi:hypothetical protein BDW75DRAFT_250859 [Aspergillus navahoensis]
MVGVPGRSKACVTCLKRKKRCDLEKPFCSTCRKTPLECGGYYRPRIFINYTIETQNRQLVKRNNNSHAPFGSDVAIPSELARSAYQARYMDLFWQIYLPNGKALSVELTHLALGKWIDTTHDLHGSESASRKIWNLKEEGRSLYTSSLKSLAVALKDAKRANSDAILTAVRLSSFYESCFGQNEGEVKQVPSWQAHNAGYIALISARSPHSFISGHTHDLFADGRSNRIMSYLRQRKRCFLADPDWKTIPWLQREKNPRDLLMDILLDLTGLFEGLDNMKAILDSDLLEKELSHQQLLDGFLQLHQDLITWQVLHAPDFEPLIQVPDNLTPRHIAGAHLMTTFWSSVTVIVSNIQALCAFESIFDLDVCCANVIRTFPAFIHPPLGLFRTHLTTYPFTVAINYISAAGPQRVVEERRILADCLYDPALSGLRQFLHMVDEMPEEFLH